MSSVITQERPSFYPDFALCDSTRDNAGHPAGLTLALVTNERRITEFTSVNRKICQSKYAKLALAYLFKHC
jgi:hypothetical protein